MEKTPSISIIMPVYNTGELLLHTVDRIITQTYPNWELILVDDGSKDIRTIEICDELGARDNRIKVYHKKNGGICDARNYGMSKAKGDYLTFCDHDDEYDIHLLERVVPYLTYDNVDILRFSYKTIYPDGKEKLFLMSDYEVKIDNKKNFFKLLSAHFFENIWCGIYRSSLLLPSGVLYDTRFKHGGEDFDFNLNIYIFIHNIVLLPDCLYLHYYRQTSTSYSLYDDIFHNFIEKQKKVNKMADNLCFSEREYDNNYYLYTSENLISLLSYGIRMKKNYSEIKLSLQSFYKLIPYYPRLSVLYNVKGNRSRFATFFLLLLKYKSYIAIYSLYRLYLIIK